MPIAPVRWTRTFLAPGGTAGLVVASVATAVVWCAAIVQPPTAAQSRPPNIVFVLADDLGVNDLGVYGRQEHRTPHLDRLAEEGLRFTTAYVASPICSPSRAAIMTGRAPARLHLTTFIPGRADASSQKLLHPQMRQQLAARGGDAGRTAAPRRLCHGGDRKVAPRRRRFHATRAGIRCLPPRAGHDHSERRRGRQGRVRSDPRGGALHRCEPGTAVLSVPRAQQSAHPVSLGTAGPHRREPARVRPGIRRNAADARRQHRPTAGAHRCRGHS